MVPPTDPAITELPSAKAFGEDERSVLGLIRHMADVERNWFRRAMLGEDIDPIHHGAGHADLLREAIDGATGD